MGGSLHMTHAGVKPLGDLAQGQCEWAAWAALLGPVGKLQSRIPECLSWQSLSLTTVISEQKLGLMSLFQIARCLSSPIKAPSLTQDPLQSCTFFSRQLYHPRWRALWKRENVELVGRDRAVTGLGVVCGWTSLKSWDSLGVGGAATLPAQPEAEKLEPLRANGAGISGLTVFMPSLSGHHGASAGSFWF